MNKTILATLVAISMIIGVGAAYNNHAHAGWLSNLAFGGKEVPSQRFKIKAQGNDLRGYLFELPGENRQCLFLAGTKKGGLSCWEAK